VITSSDKPIIRYFRGEGSIIPEYQREFAWESVLSKRMFESLDFFLQQNPQKVPHGVVPAPVINKFYLGSVITVNDTPIPIVDGQQRLTCLTILASVLRDYCIEREEYMSASKLDELFVWKLKDSVGNPHSVMYVDGTPKIILRDTGTGEYNLRENMKWICSVELRDAGDYEVVDLLPGAPAPGTDTLVLDELLHWRLGEGFTIDFSASGGQLIQASAAIDSDRILVSSGSVAVGETFTLNYGNKNGHRPADGSKIQEAETELYSKVQEILDGRYPIAGVAALPAHIGTLSQYVSEFAVLVSQIMVTQVEFDDTVAAMSHFMTVNDSTLRVGLSDLDRLRALTEIVAGSGAQATPHGTVAPGVGWNPAIRNCFGEIEDMLLNNREKKESFSADFFYYFGQMHIPARITRGEVMSTIELKLRSDMCNIAGDWKKNEFLEFLEKIKYCSGIFFRAIEGWTRDRPAGYKYLSSVSDGRPYKPTRYERNEEFFTSVLQASPSFVQWIPPYMAGNYIVRKMREEGTITTTQYSELMTILVRALTKLHVAGQIYAKGTKQNTFTGGHMHAFSNLYCGFLDNTGPRHPLSHTYVDIKQVFDKIAGDIEGELDGTAVDPKLDDPIDCFNSITECTLLNPKTLPLLMLAEWQEAGLLSWRARNPTSDAVFKSSAREVEHIQPKAPHGALPLGKGVAHAGGYTAKTSEEWEENKNRLGNRLLIEKRINSHIKDSPLTFKIGTIGIGCPIKGPCTGHQLHYRSDNSKLTLKWMEARGPTGWLSHPTSYTSNHPPTLWGENRISIWESEIEGLLMAILP
jgi:hypothetical protein